MTYNFINAIFPPHMYPVVPDYHEYIMYQKALNNFRAYHGYEPHPAMNMVTILRDYSVPWRKTTIPCVKRRKDGSGDA